MNDVRLASFWRRCGAAAIDLVFPTWVLILLVGGSQLVSEAPRAPGWIGPFWGVLCLAMGAAYWVWPYSTEGQTVGKKLLGIRVVAIDGGRLNWRNGVLRYLGEFASVFAFGLGYFWCIWDPHRQTWHDKAAGTCVVRDSGAPCAVRLLERPAARRRQRYWLIGMAPAVVVAAVAGVAAVWAFWGEQRVADDRVRLLLEADMSQVEPHQRQQVLEEARRVIERRVNALGVRNAAVRLEGENYLSVDLRGIEDLARARRLVSRTARVEFREPAEDSRTGAASWRVARARGRDGQEKELTGAYLRPNAYLTTSSQSGLPEVAFEFDEEGSVLFEQITTRLLGRQLGIFLDGELISAPKVQATIRRKGVITGLTAEAGRALAIQINSGALPVPVSIVSEEPR